MAEHTFHYEGNWSGGRQGQGQIQSGNLSSVLTTPKQLGGPGEGTNPDELLVSAAGSCFLMTVAFGMERKGVSAKELTITSTGIASDNGGLHFEKIIHRPRIVLDPDADDALIEQVKEIVKASESRCMVSKALRGNVEVLVEAEIAKG